jgi:hypothetical protein
MVAHPAGFIFSGLMVETEGPGRVQIRPEMAFADDNFLLVNPWERW